MQPPVPLHPAPLHPAKTNPLAAVALNVTCVPKATLAEQAPLPLLQLIPAGELVTVPEPFSLTETEATRDIGFIGS